MSLGFAQRHMCKLSGLGDSKATENTDFSAYLKYVHVCVNSGASGAPSEFTHLLLLLRSAWRWQTQAHSAMLYQ